MESILKVAGVAVVGAILALFVKKNNADIAILISLAVIVLIMGFCLTVIQQILGFADTLKEMSGLSNALFIPLFKAVGIGIVTKISSSVCQDAGQGGIAGFVELFGSCLALYVSLPLMSAAIDLISSLI